MPELDLAQLRAAHFQPLAGTGFRLEAGNGAALEAILTRVEVHRIPGLEGFTLSFQAPPSPALGQGVHRVVHPALGAHEIFLVPRDASAVYEAVFNRIPEPQAAERSR